MPKPRISTARSKAKAEAKSNKKDINIGSIKNKYSYSVFMITEKDDNPNDNYHALKRISPAVFDAKVAIDMLFYRLEQKIQDAFTDVFDYVDVDNYDSDEDRDYIRSLERWLNSRDGKFQFGDSLPDKLKYDRKSWEKINFSKIFKDFLERKFPNFRNISDEGFKSYFTNVNCCFGTEVISLDFFDLDDEDDSIGQIGLYLEEIPLAFRFNNALFQAAALEFPMFNKKPLHTDISKMRESDILVEFDF